MNIDDLGRHAGHDVQRSSDRLEAALPSALDLVERARQVRARRRVVGLVALLIPLVGGVALAAAGPFGDGPTGGTTSGLSTATDDDGTASTPTTDDGSAPSTTGPITIPDPGGNDEPTTTLTVVPLPLDNDGATTTTASDPAGDGLGRVSGHVLAGPTCPVETPEQPCDDVGIVATIIFTMIRDDAEFLYERQVTSASDGSYTIELAAGSYSVTVTSDSAMSCDDATVTVIDGETVTLDLSCDTGIR